MLNIKKIIFFICLFTCIIFNAFYVFADWDGETIVDIEKLYSTSADYKIALSQKQISDLGLTPQDHVDMWYQPSSRQDYLDATFQGASEEYVSKTKPYRYYPWVVGQRIEGYGESWKRGESASFGMIDTNPVAGEYPVLYLHKVTKNLYNAQTRSIKWFGNELADVIDVNPTIKEITDIPDILCKDYFLVYNFVPHVLGTEGTSQYLKQGYVLSGDKTKGVQCILNGTEPITQSQGYTGLQTFVTYPVLDNGTVTTVSKSTSFRPGLEEAIEGFGNPLLVSNIDLAFDEYIHQRNASYDFMSSIPMNAAGLSSGSDGVYPKSFKSGVNHGAIMVYDNNSDTIPAEYRNNEKGKVETSGINNSFMMYGQDIIRNKADYNSFYNNYNLRTSPTTISINGKNYPAFTLSLESGTNIGMVNSTFQPRYPSTNTEYGWYIGWGYGASLDAMGNSYRANAIDYGIKRSIFKQHPNYTANWDLDYRPWDPTGKVMSFDSQFSREFPLLTKGSPVYEERVEYVKYYMKFHPDLIFALLHNGERFQSNFGSFSVIDLKTRMLNTYNMFKTNNMSISYFDAIMLNSQTSRLENGKTDIDLFATLFYNFFSMNIPPSQYSGSISYFTRNSGNYWNSLNAPVVIDLSDLYVLNDGTRTGAKGIDDPNTVVVPQNLSAVSKGNKTGMEVYEFKTSTNTNIAMAEAENLANMKNWIPRLTPLPKENLALELGKAYVVRSYVGYRTEHLKSQNLMNNGYGETFHKDINMYMNVKYASNKIDLASDANIDVSGVNTVWKYFAVAIPMYRSTSGTTMTEGKHRAQKTTDVITGDFIYMPRYQIYESVIRVTSGGIEYLDNAGKWVSSWAMQQKINSGAPHYDAGVGKNYQQLFPDFINAVSSNSFDMSTVKSFYIETYLGREYNFYQGTATSTSGITSPLIQTGTGVTSAGTAQQKQFFGNDNQDLSNDRAGIFALADGQPDLIVPYKMANSIIKDNSGNALYSNMAVSKKDPITGLYNPSVIDANLQTTLNSGDDIKFHVYVQRSPKPSMPTDPTNPLTIKNIGFNMNERINDSIDKPTLLGSRDGSFTIYDPAYITGGNNSYSLLNSKVSAVTIYEYIAASGTYKQIKSAADSQYPKTKTLLGSKTATIDNGKWSINDVKDIPVEAGMIVMFDIPYKVPIITDIMNPANTKYDGDKKLPGTAQLLKWQVQFDFFFAGTVSLTDQSLMNSLKTNDFTKILVNCNPPKIPNLIFTNVKLKDSTGAIWAEATSKANISYPRGRNIDKTKNYYIEATVRFEQEPGKQTTNSTIYLGTVYSANGVPLPDPDSSANFVVSNRPGKWNHNDTGTFTPSSNGITNIATFTTGKTIVIPVKSMTNLQSLSVFVKIPDAMSVDNQVPDWDDQTFTFGVNNSFDDCIENIQLFEAGTTKEYKTLNPDGVTYSLDPTKRYDALITVKRKVADGINKNVNPSLKAWTAIAEEDMPTNITIGSAKTLFNLNDVIQYKITNITSENGYIEVGGHFDYPDGDISNNGPLAKIWQSQYNFTVSQFVVRPEKVYSANSYYDTPISFSATITYAAYGSSASGTASYVQNVPVEIRDYNGNIMFYEEYTLYNGIPFKINGQFKSGAAVRLYYNGGGGCYSSSNVPFDIAVNGGEDGSFRTRKYTEKTADGTPYADNEKTSEINYVYTPAGCAPRCIDCDRLNLNNSWSVTFYMFKQTGTLVWGTVTRCNKSGCRDVRVSWCEDVETEDWEETRSYYENFKIESVMFRSPSTINKYGGTGWINIMGNTNGVVHAGQWFEFYAVTSFNTNRNNMPATWRRNKCNYQTRTPGVSPFYDTPSYICMVLSGYGPTETYSPLYHYQSSGGWYSNKRYYRAPNKIDIMGETDVRRYIPVTGKNGVLNIAITTLPFRGHESDDNHPREELQDCKSAKIYIKEPLPTETQILGH